MVKSIAKSATRAKLLLVCILIPCLLRGWEPIPLDAPGHEWMDEAIEKEFYPFRKGISQRMLDHTWKTCSKIDRFLRYQIISGTVYGPPSHLKNLLDVMVQCYPVPDIDFIYYNHDILRDSALKKYGIKNNAPIFVSAKDKSQQATILFVDWYYNILDQYGGWNGAIHTIEETYSPWNTKLPKLFWRGGPTDGHYTLENWKKIPRGALVYSSQKYPELIDASFSVKAGSYTEEFARQIGFSSYVSLLDHLQYKYQIIMQGITCTYPGTQWRLLSGCLTFKQTTPDIMWFFSALTPWKHYIPVAKDLSDLTELLLWAQAHDDLAQRIAEEAHTFAQTHLMPEHILLYCYKALLKYASL